MYVIGTAGHVDHGKSALIEALTGTHPDRLREEQERGLTIELGFAWLTLPSAREVSIVDVPGHVRFVRHMLAGAGAIDLALFVVAADEGVMPQTREHLEILDLLGVDHAVIALTKCDMVDDPGWLDLVEEEVRTLIDATTLAGAPIVRTSVPPSGERQGLDALKQTLDAALDGTPEPRDIGRPRLGIDRVFTMAGFGTVVTGTLLDGRLHVGDSVEAAPDGPTARIRGLQMHRQERDEAEPGTRVAVNLAGLSTDDLRRGQVLTPPGRIAPVTAFDARVRVLDHRPLRHNLRVALHLGSDEVQARVRVLGSDGTDGYTDGGTEGENGRGDEVPPGEQGWCQLVLSTPVAAVAGDLFVLRVSDTTVAGGRIVETNPPRHRRNEPATIERLEARAAGTPESQALAALERLEPCPAAELAPAVELDGEALASALASLVERGEVRELAAPPGEPVYVTAGGLERLAQQAQRALDRYHAAHPLRFAMPREELRSRLALGQREFGAALPALDGVAVLDSGGAAGAAGVAREGWTPSLTAAQRRQAEEVLAALEAAGAAPPRLDLDGELLAYIEGDGQVVDCGDGVVLATAAFAGAEETVAAVLRERGPATLGELRDALGTNRRAAQAILETMDRRGLTRRQGDARVLREEPR